MAARCITELPIGAVEVCSAGSLPAGQEVAAVRPVRDDIRARIETQMEELLGTEGLAPPHPDSPAPQPDRSSSQERTTP